MMERWIETSIGQLYTRFRQGRTPLVFLSGQGYFSTSDNFAHLLKQLPAERGYLTIDYPNAGRSSLTNQAGRTLADWTESFCHIMQTYEISDYVICAHSIGGVLAKQLIATYSGTCHGFIGLEASTFDILRGELARNPYPELIAHKQALKASPHAVEDHLEQLLKVAHSQEESQTLMEQYRTIRDRLREQSEDFAAVIELKDEDFQLKLDENLPSLLIGRAFRKQEYLLSEYWTKHPASQLVLLGDNHYLHWTDSQQIGQLIQQFLEGMEK